MDLVLRVEGSDGIVTLQRSVVLPFVPVNGIILRLFSDVSLTLADVGWDVEDECFIGRLDGALPQYSTEDIQQWFVKDGWKPLVLDKVGAA